MEESKAEEAKRSDTEEESSPEPKAKKQKITEKQKEALAKGRAKKKLLNEEKHRLATGHTELERELNRLKEEHTRLYQKTLESDIEKLKGENEKLREKDKPRTIDTTPIATIEKVHPPPPPAPRKEVPAFVFF